MTKEDVLDIVRRNAWNIQSFSARPLFLCTPAHRPGWMVADEFGAGYTHFFYLYGEKKTHMYYDEADWRRIGEAYYSKIENTEELNRLIERYENGYATALSQSSAVVGASVPELVADVVSNCEQFVHAIGFSHAIEGITFESERRLQEALSKRGVADELLLSKLCSPTHRSLLFDAQCLLWDIQKAEGPERERLVDSFLMDWSWIENTYLGSAHFDRALVLARAREIKQEPSASDYAAIRDEKEKLLVELSFSHEERFIVETINACFLWQDRRKMHVLKAVERLDRSVEKLAAALQCDPEVIKWATHEEIADGKLSSLAFHEELQRRRIGAAVYAIPGRTEFFTGADYEFFLDALHVPVSDGITELRGMSASHGTARGVVRVCQSVSDIGAVQEGEILVASMTRPEYLPAMRRAAACITDEGGVTSHAAIVMRELRKPCIIGTKIATKVFKDGDMVEVDADKGIVRLVTKYEIV